ncbi:MAG: glycosyltransferase family 2 protein [Haloferacaceae archaeon]
MDVSVVVPTLNGRDRLVGALDSLAAHAPGAEVIVVNGPSADGTTGMVRARDDVDVLVEVSTRTLNVARNAGIEAATGDVVVFLGDDLVVGEEWLDAVRERFRETDADAVAGPSRRRLRAGVTAAERERSTIADGEVTFFDGGNVAVRAAALRAADGFDEYLETGGARDLAHRLGGMGRRIEWADAMTATHEYEADGGRTDRDWGWKYRALTYRLVKSYGLRADVATVTVREAVTDAAASLREVVRGDGRPTAWLGDGRDVVSGVVTGASDAIVARGRDRSVARNPHGLSARDDRAVAVYDWR